MSADVKPQTLKFKPASVTIGGEAGQGVLVSGIILAEAAAKDGATVAQSARYGAAVRGGEALAHVVIADQEIDFPHVERPDYLIVVSQSTYDACAPAQAESTLVLYDPFFVTPKKLDQNVRQIGIPSTDAAIKASGNAQTANLIILSALIELTGMVSAEALGEAVKQNLSKRFWESNQKALAQGQELARAALEVKS